MPSTSKKHKYIAKIRRSNGSYRYFYSKAEYQSYLQKGKSAVSALVGKLKGSGTASAVSASTATFAEKGKNAAAKVMKKIANKTAFGFVFLIRRDTIKKAVSWIADKIKSVGTKNNDDTAVDENAKISDREKPGHKYIAKVETSNGKYRYFYDQDEYDAYLKRQKYQENEPDFMKHVADIDPDTILTKEENMDKINEAFDPYVSSTTTNCANCSAAYELRMRGYDVEARLNNGTGAYNGDGDRMYDYFENAKKLYVNADGSTTTADESVERKIWNKEFTKRDARKNPETYKFYTEPHSYSASSIEKAIKDNNPPGSRGFIDVDWNMGSGHSIVYEVDKSGKVTIRDSQTYDVYDVSELSGRVSKVTITRTDNLTLKKDILNTVRTNDDGKRSYYMDDGDLHRSY